MSIEFMQIYNLIIIAIQNFVFVYIGEQVAERRFKSFLVTYFVMSSFIIGFRYLEVALQNINIIFGICMLPFISVIVFGSSFKAPCKKLFIVSLIFVVVSVFSEIMTVLIIQLLLDFQHKDYTNPMVQYVDQSIGSVLAMCLTNMQGLLYLFLYKRRRKNIKPNEFVLTIMMMLYQFVVILLFYESCKEYDMFSLIAGTSMCLFSTLINIFTLYAVEKLNENKKAKQQYNELMEQRAKELVYYEKQYKQIENLRILRHEFANYLQTVQELVVKKEDTKIAEDILNVIEHRLTTSNFKL